MDKKKPTITKTKVKKAASKTASKVSARPKKVSLSKEKTLKKPIKAKVIKPKAAVTKSPKATSQKELETVTLPTNMSLRSVEKATVLSSELRAYIKDSAFKIAYVSGLCFILVGATFSSSLIFPNTNSLYLAGNTIDTTAETTPTVKTQVSAPTFSFISEVPDEMNEPTNIKFTVTDIDKISAKLVKVSQVGFYDLEVENLSNNNYRTEVPATSLPAGYYQLNIYVTALVDLKPLVFQSKVFKVGDPREPEPVVKDIIVITDEKDTEEEVEIEDKEDEVVEPAEPEVIESEVESFSLFTDGSLVLTGPAMIGINVPPDYTYAELYARPLQSLAPRFVVLAAKRFEKLRFDFDSTNIPNGQYEFFAKVKNEKGVVITDSINLSVNNGIYEATAPITESRPLIVVEDVTTDYIPTNVLADDVNRETKDLLLENENEINRLLELYAIARQSGNELMIKEAKAALDEKREEIIFSTLQDQSIRDISDDISEELSKIIDNLKSKVDSFEQIRKDRSEGVTAVDTDLDGVSDFDEINIYKTNPESSDSDNDGVIDGVEIVKGFNPLDDSSEAVISFESPTETIGLVRNDIMKINSVVPIIEVGADVNAEVIKTEITGQALPNSYVTLFIFSTPTVVTIKTDSDGSFSYTFNKELEDGNHEIYVAITDNTGSIIAQSNPFRFIKEAQAFTPVDATNEENIAEAAPTNQTSKDTINVIGMSILALGLILIMLGISLRSRNEIKFSDSNSTPIT